MEKIKSNCKKSKSCSECGKCKPKKNNQSIKNDNNIDIEKFKDKCEKKLRFLQSFEPDHKNLINLVEPIALALNSDLDDENLNRIIEHPKRLLYHANEILKIYADIGRTDIICRENLMNLKICILFHDIGKTAKFKKYNADRKMDHHLFSSVIIRTAMTYMKFDNDQIELVDWVIRNHNDESMTVEECLAAPFIFRLLLDVDKIDENDVYGVILKSIVRGNERKIKRNNLINQNELKEWITEFRNNNIRDTLLDDHSKIYYDKIRCDILKLIEMISFERDEDLFKIYDV